jgi:uncharacterized damage-inducible protein DinB
MTELEQILVGDAYAARPASILEGLSEELIHRKPSGAPHSIYEELWHIAFWQQVTLNWIGGIETPFPASPADGFPTVHDMEGESWPVLYRRFLQGVSEAVQATKDEARLNRMVRCPSRPGKPVRTMSVREQLENMGAHNAYHLGRIVLLRQLLGAWPSKSGGFTW